MLTGDNNVLKRATDTREKKERTQIVERIRMAEIAAVANGSGDLTEANLKAALTQEFGVEGTGYTIADGSDGNSWDVTVSGVTENISKSGSTTPQNQGGGNTTPRTIAEAKPASGGIVTALSDKDATTLQDDLGNEVKVPKGFGIAEDSGTKVEEGIVIEDADSSRETFGSQFVWVSVGTGIKVSTEISASGMVDIPLVRYVFNTSTGVVDEILSKTQPSDQLKTSSSSSYYYTEGLKDETTGNIHAKDITTFVSKANSNGGYYIARYEAGINADKDQYAYANCSSGGASLTYGDSSKMFAKDGTVKPLSIKGKGIWNAVTQLEAATISRSMYNTTNDKVTSDLVNSYAWDTAIVFIQKCRKQWR